MGRRGVRSYVAPSQSDLRRWASAVSALTALCLLGAPGPARASSKDRLATHAYLQASYELDLASAHNRAAANAADRRAGAAIAAECPKVLAGAPGNPQGTSPPIAPAKLAPRARGEADRLQRQFSALTSEFETAVRIAAFKLDAGPFAKYAAQVTALHWSDPAIARSIRAEISIIRDFLEPGPAPAVCADMRFWVASGYRALSAGTLALQARQEGLLRTALSLVTVNPAKRLKRYEGPSERALLRRTAKLKSQELFESGGAPEAKFRRALGIEEAPPAARQPRPTIIGHGRTRSGAKFEVEVSRGPGPHCREIISVSLTVTSSEGSYGSGGTGRLRCLSGGVPKAGPEVSCEEGSIEVVSTTLAATRDVRLTLSDGSTVLSGVTPVSKRYGGPAGAYVQAVPGPSPYPVSLSELDAAGALLRTVPLRPLKGCRHASRTTGAPTILDLVHGTTPAGEAFTILASSSVRKGHRTVDFYATGVGSLFEAAVPTTPVTGPGAAARYFPWTLTVGCQRETVSVIYGRLKATGDTVLVASATTGLTALTEVPLPAALKVAGTFAYAVLAGVPSELVVRDANGRTLVREDLTARAGREIEYCEGYAEPAA